MESPAESSGPPPVPVRPVRLTPAPAPGARGEDASPAGFSKRRLTIAFAIAGLSDVLSAFLVFAPPIQWGIDVATALLLFSVLGWRWMILPGLVMEAIPGVSVFPFWVLVVVAVAIWGTAQPKLN